VGVVSYHFSHIVVGLLNHVGADFVFTSGWIGAGSNPCSYENLHKLVFKAISIAYIELVRGTPALMQIMLVYFGLPALGLNIDRLTAAVVALGLNSAAYSGEIFRAGIESIDKGQMEAARAIGMTGSMAMRLIILPQAFRMVIPPLVNEFVALLKDTSLVSVIGVADLMLRSRNMISYTANVFTPLLGASILYLLATIPGSQLSAYLERRFKF